VRGEKLVCPRSWFHREAGSLTSLDGGIQRYLRYISQIDFEPPFEIEKRQFFNAACAFLGKDAYYTSWKQCMESDPDEHLTRFTLEANMSMDVFNFRERRTQHATDMNATAALKGREYAQHLAAERAGVTSYLDGCYGWEVRHVFSGIPQGDEQYKAFLADRSRCCRAVDGSLHAALRVSAHPVQRP
jgi:hypothetical protein